MATGVLNVNLTPALAGFALESFDQLPAPIFSIEGMDNYKITETELKRILNGSGARLVNKRDDDLGISLAAAGFFGSFLEKILLSIYELNIWVKERLGYYNDVAQTRLVRADYLNYQYMVSPPGAQQNEYERMAIEEYSRVITLMEKHGIKDIQRFDIKLGTVERLSFADVYAKRAELLLSSLDAGKNEIDLDDWGMLGDDQNPYLEPWERGRFTDEAVEAYKDLVDAAAVEAGVGEGIEPSKEAQRLIRFSDGKVSYEIVGEYLIKELGYLTKVGRYEEVARRTELAARLDIKLSHGRLQIIDQLLFDAGMIDLIEGVLKTYQRVYAENGAWEKAAEAALNLGEYYKEKNNWGAAGEAFERAALYYGYGYMTVITNDKNEAWNNMKTQIEALNWAVEAYQKAAGPDDYTLQKQVQVKSIEEKIQMLKVQQKDRQTMSLLIMSDAGGNDHPSNIASDTIPADERRVKGAEKGRRNRKKGDKKDKPLIFLK